MTLFEIVEEIKNGNKPDYEDLKYALLAYVSMLNIEHRQLREELMRDKLQPQFLRDMKLKNSFDMYKTALSKRPKEWIGWANDPDNPEYQKMRTAGIKVIETLQEEDKVDGC